MIRRVGEGDVWAVSMKTLNSIDAARKMGFMDASSLTFWKRPDRWSTSPAARDTSAGVNCGCT